MAPWDVGVVLLLFREGNEEKAHSQTCQVGREEPSMQLSGFSDMLRTSQLGETQAGVGGHLWLLDLFT